MAQVELARRTTRSSATDAPFARWVREGAPVASSNPPPLQIAFDASMSQLRLVAGPALADPGLLEVILRAIADTAADLLARPGEQLDRIRSLPSDDRQRQLAEWNAAPAPYDRTLTVHGVFADVASRQGTRPALVGEHETLSYEELARRSELVARRLQSAGVRAGDKVGTLLDRSAAAVEVLLGILKAGATYVPVQPDFPAERVAFMLADAGVSLVVTQSAHRQGVPAGLPLLQIDGETQPADSLAPLSAAPTDGESLAYVMYTSGSTGTPKGIEICHRAILRLVRQRELRRPSPDEAMLHAAPLGFDASTLEIWGPLLNGGRCVLHDEDLPTGRGPRAHHRAQKASPTAWLTAALFNAVVDDDPRPAARAEAVAHRRRGAVRRACAPRASRRCPALRSSTATALPSARRSLPTYRIPHDLLPADARSIPIGRPINDTQAYVLARRWQPLPPASSANLRRRPRPGARLSEAPRADRRALRAQSVRAAGASGSTAPGDLVRWLPDGNIEFVGRTDGAGQDPRLSHRAGRNRERARCASRHQVLRGGRSAPDGNGRLAARRLPGRPCSEHAVAAVARAPGRAPARIHGARGLRMA